MFDRFFKITKMADYEIIMIDGGLSTELESVGFEIGKTRLWTAKCLLDKPDLLKQAHIKLIKLFFFIMLNILLHQSHQTTLIGMYI